MRNKEYPFFTVLFLAASAWNLIGAIFGYFNTELTFEGLFGRELNDPLFYDIYKGAWGTTLVYFIGYLLVAYNPVKHMGIVIVGGIGKLAFAIKLLQFWLSGYANDIVFIIIIGDFIFTVLFIYYFIKLKQLKQQLF